jgi:hypothetical protein
VICYVSKALSNAELEYSSGVTWNSPSSPSSPTVMRSSGCTHSRIRSANSEDGSCGCKILISKSFTDPERTTSTQIFSVPEANALDANPFDDIECGRDLWFDRLKQRIAEEALRFPNFRIENGRLYKSVRERADITTNREPVRTSESTRPTLRTAKHEATRKTPYFVNFGHEMIYDERQYARIRDQARFAPSSDSDDDDDNDHLTRLTRIRHEVRQKLQWARERAKLFYDHKRRPLSFEKGDLVWKREYPSADSTKHFTAKLAKRFKGPYTVAQRIGSNVYALNDPLVVPAESGTSKI